MTGRQARDEGAEQTKRIVGAVKRRRGELGWSAQQLADEMTKVGVPWNADVVVNLEHGRRKSLRVHELLALLFVLGVDKPLDVLIPGTEPFPVVPDLLVEPGEIRLWLRGDGRPLLQKVAGDAAPREAMESAAQLFEQQGQPEMAATMRRLASLVAIPDRPRYAVTPGADDGQD